VSTITSRNKYPTFLKSPFKETSWFTRTVRNTKQSLKKSKEQLVSYLKRLLSEENRRFVMALVLLLAVVIAVVNIISKENEQITVKPEENSVLVSLLYGDNGIETVTNETPVLVKEQRLSPIAIAKAAPAEAESSKSAVDSAVPPPANDMQSTVQLLGSDTLVRNSAVDTVVSDKPREDIVQYKVRTGDTVTSIAKKFSVDEGTILEENKLFADDYIKPGDTLTILPVAGTTERVDKGETLESIAKKHGADMNEVMAFNDIENADDVEFAEILLIPGGKREVKNRPKPEPVQTVAAAPTRQQASTRTSSSSSQTSTSKSTQKPVVKKGSRVGNRFPWGWCTWYVAEKRGDVTWRGNAGTWLGGARSSGRATGSVPAVGAIMVTGESGYGHVAYVEAVNGSQVTVSEMNYRGFGVVSSRTISSGSRVIKGYVY